MEQRTQKNVTHKKKVAEKQSYLYWRTQEVLQFEASPPDSRFSRYKVCDIIAVCAQLQNKVKEKRSYYFCFAIERARP